MLYNNYHLGHLSCVYSLNNVAIFISKYAPSALYQFDNCGTSMYELANENLQEKLKDPKDFYREFVEKLFNNELERSQKKPDTKVNRNIDDDIYYAIFSFTQTYFTITRLKNKYFEEAVEDKFIECMRKYPQITKYQHFKGITLGMSFADYGLDRCTEFIIKHRESHAQIKDKKGQTMFDYMRPELLQQTVELNPETCYKTLINQQFSALDEL